MFYIFFLNIFKLCSSNGKNSCYYKKYGDDSYYCYKLYSIECYYVFIFRFNYFHYPTFKYKLYVFVYELLKCFYVFLLFDCYYHLVVLPKSVSLSTKTLCLCHDPVYLQKLQKLKKRFLLFQVFSLSTIIPKSMHKFSKIHTYPEQ